MYYIEFIMVMKNGKITIVNVEPHEEADQRAYCKEGVRGGWMKSWSSNNVKEEY